MSPSDEEVYVAIAQAIENHTRLVKIHDELLQGLTKRIDQQVKLLNQIADSQMVLVEIMGQLMSDGATVRH